MKVGRNDPCPCKSGKKYKKCCLMNDDRKPHETLAKFVGSKWIETELGKVKLDGYNNMNPMNLARMDMHPLIKAIAVTQIKLQISNQNGKTPIALGRDELLQNLLHENLTILDPILDVADLQKRLRNKDEFPKAEYELAVAAGYARMGYKPSFIPRSSSKRTGEFYVSDKDGNTVLVECKKKDMTSPKEQKITSWWEEFQHLMIQKLKSIKKPYGIAIHIPHNPERTETHLAVDEIAKIIFSNQEGKNTVINGKYRVTLEKFCEIGGSANPHQVSLFGRNADFNVSVAKQDKSAWPLGNKLPTALYDPMKVSGYSSSNFLEEKVNSIISTLGDAYGQLVEDKPNVVYVDINVATMAPERSSAIMTALPSEIMKKLGSDYSKISAVVLTNLKLLGHSEIMGFHPDEHVVYNANARKQLPEGFLIYGDIVNGQSILADIKVLFEKK